MRRGDLYLCDLGHPIGHEQGFQRPVVIVSATQTVEYGLPLVAPLTRTARGYPTHVELDGVLPVVSYIQCEQLRVVSTERLLKKLGRVGEIELMKVETILRRLLAL